MTQLNSSSTKQFFIPSRPWAWRCTQFPLLGILREEFKVGCVDTVDFSAVFLRNYFMFFLRKIQTVEIFEESEALVRMPRRRPGCPEDSFHFDWFRCYRWSLPGMDVASSQSPWCPANRCPQGGPGRLPWGPGAMVSSSSELPSCRIHGRPVRDSRQRMRQWPLPGPRGVCGAVPGDAAGTPRSAAAFVRPLRRPRVCLPLSARIHRWGPGQATTELSSMLWQIMHLTSRSVGSESVRRKLLLWCKGSPLWAGKISCFTYKNPSNHEKNVKNGNRRGV